MRSAKPNFDLLVEVVINHHRDSISGCRCGWGKEAKYLGLSHAEHVVDEQIKALFGERS